MTEKNSEIFWGVEFLFQNTRIVQISWNKVFMSLKSRHKTNSLIRRWGLSAVFFVGCGMLGVLLLLWFLMLLSLIFFILDLRHCIYSHSSKILEKASSTLMAITACWVIVVPWVMRYWLGWFSIGSNGRRGCIFLLVVLMMVVVLL